MKLVIPSVALILAGSFASAATLTFDGDICNGGQACLNRSEIDQTYGDIAGQVDVIYDADAGTAEKENVLFWGTSYETLTNVAYSIDSGSGMIIDFVASPGYAVTLSGFDIAPYANRVRNTQIVIKEIGGSTLFDSGIFSADTDGVTSFSGSYTSAVGISLEFGPDSWDVGIDNIEYTTAEIAPVPLPATGLMLVAGLGGLFASRRRKQMV